jgi:hypothetical protein
MPRLGMRIDLNAHQSPITNHPVSFRFLLTDIQLDMTNKKRKRAARSPLPVAPDPVSAEPPSDANSKIDGSALPVRRKKKRKRKSSPERNALPLENCRHDQRNLQLRSSSGDNVPVNGAYHELVLGLILHYIEADFCFLPRKRITHRSKLNAR